MNTAKSLDSQDKPSSGFVRIVSRGPRFIKVLPGKPVERVCPITQMSESRADELSRAMVDVLESVSPRGQRYVKA